MHRAESFRRLFWSYLIIIIGPIVIVGAVAVSLFFGRLANHAQALNESILLQTQSTIDSFFENAASVACGISRNEDVQHLIRYSDQLSTAAMDYYYARKELAMQASGNGAIKSVGVFLPRSGTILDSDLNYSVEEYFNQYLHDTAYDLSWWQELFSSGADRAFFAAQRASAAFVRVYVIAYKLRTFSSGTAVFFYVSLVFVAEISERGENGIRSRLTESAERAVLYLSAQLFEQLDISVSAIALAYPLKSFSQAHSTDAAWYALPARLVCCEIEKEFCHAHHAGVLVHNDHTARTHHAADGGEVVVVYLGVHEARGDASAGRSAGLSRLELLAGRDAAADDLDDLSEGGAHRDLDETGVGDLSAESEDL